MADVRLLIQEEGRAARNLIAFNVPVGTNNIEKITKKPPSVPRQTQTGSSKRSMKPVTRVRSASTGRDKKSGKIAFFPKLREDNYHRCLKQKMPICYQEMKKQIVSDIFNEKIYFTNFILYNYTNVCCIVLKMIYIIDIYYIKYY